MKTIIRFVKPLLGTFVALALNATGAVLPADLFLRKVEISFPGFNSESESLRDFPMPVIINAASLKGFSSIECLAKDIFFADDVGNELAFEVDTWNPEGKSVVWVKIPELAKGTKIAMYYLPVAEVPRVTTSADVWSDYIAVWHMTDTKIRGVVDSTGNGHDLKVTPKHNKLRSVESSDLGSAVRFHTRNQGYTANSVRDAIQGLKGLSMEVFYKMSSSKNNPKIFCSRSEGDNDSISFAWQFTDNTWRPQLQLWRDDSTRWNGMEDKAVFKRIGEKGTLSFNLGSDGRLVHYMNGLRNHDGNDADFTVDGWSAININPKNDLCVGCRTLNQGKDVPDQGWDGVIDELRVSGRNDRSALWQETFHRSILANGFTAFKQVEKFDADAPSATYSIFTTMNAASVSFNVVSAGKGGDTASVEFIVSETPDFATKKVFNFGVVAPLTEHTLNATDLKPSTLYYAKLVIDGATRREMQLRFSTKSPILGGAYQRKVDLQIPGYTAEEEVLENFPVLVTIDPAVIKGFSYEDCAPDGRGIAFVDEAGNELAHEVDTWNTAGKSFVWVKVPRLAKDTKLTMYYDPCRRVPHSTRSEDVWSEYLAVWHMNDTQLRGVSDSTGRGHSLEVTTEHDAMVSVDAAIGGGVYFPTNNQGYVANSVRDAIIGAKNLEVEVVFQRDQANNAVYRRVLNLKNENEKGSNSNYLSLILRTMGKGVRPEIDVKRSDQKCFSGRDRIKNKDYDFDKWSTAAFAISADVENMDSSSQSVGVIDLYHRGDHVANRSIYSVRPWSELIASTNMDLCVGFPSLNPNAKPEGFKGVIDELRVSIAGSRSALWYETINKTVTDSGFIAFGKCQEVSECDHKLTCRVQPWTLDAEIAYDVSDFVSEVNDIALRVSETPDFSNAREFLLERIAVPAKGIISVKELKPSTKYYAQLVAKDSSTSQRCRVVDMEFTTQDGVPMFDQPTLIRTADGCLEASCMLVKDSIEPITVECYFGLSSDAIDKRVDRIKKAARAKVHTSKVLPNVKDDTPYYVRFKAVYGNGREVWSDVVSYSTGPVKGALIFEDDFSQPLLFAEHWRLKHNHIRPELNVGECYFKGGGAMLMRRETPQEFWAEMDFVIPPDTGAQHPARGGFVICGTDALIGHTGNVFVWRGPKVRDFEFGKPVKFEIIRRRKDENQSECIYYMNGEEIKRSICANENPNDRDWGELQIYASALPYKVTHFAIWSLVDDPRGPSPNLIANSSFESDYDGMPELFQPLIDFSIQEAVASNKYEHCITRVAVDTAVKHSGKQSLRLVCDGYTKSVGFQSHTGASEDQECVLSVWMRADREDLPVAVSYGKNAEVKVGTKWERFEFPAVGGRRGAIIRLKDKGTLWIDDLQAEAVQIGEDGNIDYPPATQYRPSESDKLKVFFSKLDDSEVLPKPTAPKTFVDKVASNRLKGKDVDGKPIKPLEVLGRLSFYMNEPEAVFRLTVNVPVPAGATAVLKCAGVTVKAPVPALDVPGAEVELKLPITKVATGTYPAVAEVLGPKGESLAKGEGELKKLPYKAGASQINHFSRSLLHDGKPVVPVALFVGGLFHPYTASSNAVAAKLDLYQSGGIKTAHALFPFYDGSEDIDPKKISTGHLEFMDGTQRRGMYSMPWSELIFASDEKLAKFSEYINARTNVLAILVLDEPEIHNHYNGTQAEEHVRRMRAADPYHPMYMNQAFFGIPSNYANRQSDIFMIDDYLTNNHQMRTVASVVDNAIDMWNCGVEKGVPVWFFLVGANMGLHGREPSYAQQIAQTYGCLAAGCSGFSYFYGTIQTPGNWKAIRQIAQEMEVLTPAICSEERCGKTVSDVNEASLRIRTKRHDDFVYVMSCNIEDKSLGTVKLTLPPECAGATQAEVLFENRTVKIRNGVIQDNFPRWTRHVYKVAARR